VDKWQVRSLLRRDLRDLTLFLGGLTGVAHETFFVGEPREVLLLLFAAMMGLPAFLRFDEQQARKEDEGP
jgi:hypothetical protein